MKRYLLIVPILILALASISWADVFTWTDTTSGVGGTVYTLTIMNGNATFQAQTSTHSGWYFDWISFHLNGGSKPDLNNLSAPTTDWQIADSGTGDVALEQIGSFPANGNAGFYVTGILDPATIAGVQQGALLDGSTYNWSFDFALASGTTLNPTPSLKVGYYDGVKTQGGFYFTQMSQKFEGGGKVPEPISLILLGSGLAGAGLYRRFRKLTNS